MKITYNSTNYYLIPCNDGFLLIDAGWNGLLRVFLEKLHSIGIAPVQIKYILLTHHHHDHAAIVQELRKMTEAKLIVHKEQLPYFIKYQYRPIDFDAADVIVDSDIDDVSLRNIGVQGKIVLTPGHSHDSISVLLDNGNAYIGDLAMNMNSMKLLGKAPFPIEAEDYLQVNQSLRKLVNLGVTLFYPSHGEVVTQEKIVETVK